MDVEAEEILSGSYRTRTGRKPACPRRHKKHRKLNSKKLGLAAEQVLGQANGQKMPGDAPIDEPVDEPRQIVDGKKLPNIPHPPQATNDNGTDNCSGSTLNWCLTTSLVIRPPISLPFLTGWEVDDTILLRDLWSDELYLTSLKDGTTKEVFVDNQLKGDVFHCSPLGRDRIVYCDSKSGLVHICTVTGEHLKTIATTHRPSTHMYTVAVDNQGRIVFGVRDGNIFIIDPEERKIVSSFKIDCKIDKVICSSSGYLLIRSGISKFNVVLDGAVVQTITDPDWCWAACFAHPIQDKIFVAYSKESDGSNRRIVTMRPTGEIMKDEPLELGDAPHRFMRPSVIITDSCKIIVCDNGQLLVYEQKETHTS